MHRFSLTTNNSLSEFRLVDIILKINRWHKLVAHIWNWWDYIWNTEISMCFANYLTVYDINKHYCRYCTSKQVLKCPDLLQWRRISTRCIHSVALARTLTFDMWYSGSESSPLSRDWRRGHATIDSITLTPDLFEIGCIANSWTTRGKTAWEPQGF